MRLDALYLLLDNVKVAASVAAKYMAGVHKCFKHYASPHGTKAERFTVGAILTQLLGKEVQAAVAEVSHLCGKREPLCGMSMRAERERFASEWLASQLDLVYERVLNRPQFHMKWSYFTMLICLMHARNIPALLLLVCNRAVPACFALSLSVNALYVLVHNVDRCVISHTDAKPAKQVSCGVFFAENEPMANTDKYSMRKNALQAGRDIRSSVLDGHR